MYFNPRLDKVCCWFVVGRAFLTENLARGSGEPLRTASTINNVLPLIQAA